MADDEAAIFLSRDDIDKWAILSFLISLLIILNVLMFITFLLFTLISEAVSPLAKKAFENIEGQGEYAGNPCFLLFRDQLYHHLR